MTQGHGGHKLTDADISVLRVMVRQEGRVTGRETLTRMAGLDSASARRVDACLVALRRVLGADAIRSVRQRGWILTETGLKSSLELLAERVEMKP